MQPHDLPDLLFIGFPVKEPCAYRLEAWLKLDGEWRPWIFSNPVYVR